LKGYVIAYDGKTGAQAFRAKRRDGLLASIDIFFERESMTQHPDVTEWRVWECSTGRDITLIIAREREAKLPVRETLTAAQVPDLLGDVPE
jgi:hypothetical protein